ncbi:hypothetical protein SAMN05216311_102440 [Chitinophaga sp. CF418]|nr:hypothetical protein SAMN05216311_102440 [Chitinophaga sp. CF418]
MSPPGDTKYAIVYKTRLRIIPIYDFTRTTQAGPFVTDINQDVRPQLRSYLDGVVLLQPGSDH